METRGAWRARLLVLSGYVALVFAYSWPLPLHLSERVVLARGADFYPHIWNLWWVRFSIFELGQNPYYTEYLHFPTGLPLFYHVLDPLNGLASAPLQVALGLVTAFNLMRLLHVLFAALAAYALGRALGLPRWAAWAGGALYMLCPTMSTAFGLGQLVEISTGWIPLYILCLMRALGNRALAMEPGRPWWLAGAALALVASALATWYFFIALVIFTLLYVGWELLSWGLARKARGRGGENPTVSSHGPVFLIGRAAVVGLAAVMLLSPLVLALLGESGRGVDLTSPLRTVVANSADLVAVFTPAPARLDYPVLNPHGGEPALGWTVVLLAAAGLVLWKRATAHQRLHGWFWLAAAVLFTLLALGPRLLVGGSDTGIPAPYALLSNVPFLGVARVPLRFMLLASLALSLLAAFGLVGIARRLSERSSDSSARPNAARNPALTGALAAAGMLAAFELLPWGRTLVTPEAHPFFKTIRAEGGSGAADGVLELPQGPRTAPAMFPATVHQHPIVAGYTSRHYPYPWLDTTPGISQLVRADPEPLRVADIVSPPVTTTALTALDAYGVRYVAVYTTGDPDIDGRLAAVVDELFTKRGIMPTFTDPSLNVYTVPPQPRDAPIVRLDEGWHGVETNGTLRWRWTDGRARVVVNNPRGEEMQALFRAAVYSLSAPRTLVILVDGQERLRTTVSPFPAQPLEIELLLEPGDHSIDLRSLEPSETPEGDSREIAIGFLEVSIEPR